jgi:xylulokinase
VDTIIGIDIGTTNTKAAVYNLSGEMVAFETRKTITHHSRPQYSEFDGDEIWECVRGCISELAANPSCGNIQSIGISSFGESSVLIGKDGKPLYPIISWFDQRATKQAHNLKHIIGEKELYGITGQFLSPKFGICKLLWIKDNVPEVFSKASKCLTVHDYIIYRLTGIFATDYSMASRMMCFDVRKLDWASDILSAISIPMSLMPEAHPGGTRIGTISSSVAASIGLKEGIPVSTGGHDHACAAVAVNIFEHGVMLDSMGTAETTIVATENIIDADKGFDNQICAYPHFGSKPYRAITSMQACGATIEWFVRVFGASAIDASNKDINIYEQLLIEATQSADGIGNLMFVPHIRGLQENPLAKGAFVGIDDRSDRGSFIRAIAEGISFEMRRRIESCEQAFSTSYETLRVVGGLSNSVRQMKIKAAITRKRIEIPECNEAASCGAALLGAIGAGLIDESTLSNVHQKRAVYLPESGDVAIAYEAKYRDYVKVQDDICHFYSPSD